MQVIETKTATYSMLEKDILLVGMKEDAVIDVPEVEENYYAGIKLTGGKRFGALIDGRKYVTVTPEAKKYSSQPAMTKDTIAHAIVITSLASRLIANFLTKVFNQNKNVVMKLFTDYDAALNWLREKVKEEKIKNLSEELHK
jgi:hypothetical protein